MNYTRTIVCLSVFAALLVCSSGDRITFDAEPSAGSRELLQQNRKTTQAQVQTVVLGASGDGGLEVAGFYTLNATKKGDTFSNTTGAVTLSLSGGSLTTSIVYSNVACVDLAYNATGDGVGVGGFLSTQDDYLAMLSSSGTSFYLREAKPIPGSNLTASKGQATTVTTDPIDLYVFLNYNLGKASTQITVHYNGHPAGSPACAAAGPALSAAPSADGTVQDFSGGNLVVSPAPSPYGLGDATYTQTAQVVQGESLASGDLLLLGAITNATCIAYVVYAQLAGTVTRHLDLTVFILDEDNQKEWASQGFSLNPENVTIAANCSQTYYQSGDCYNTLDNLSPTSRYFLWGVSGLQSPNSVPDPTYLAMTFTAQSEGSCENNVMTTYTSSIGADYYGDEGVGPYAGSYNYDYSQYYGDYTAAPPFFTGSGSPPKHQGSSSGSGGGGVLPGSKGHSGTSSDGASGIGLGSGSGQSTGDSLGTGQGNGMGSGLGNGQGNRQEGRNTTRKAAPPSVLFSLPTGK